MDVLTKRWKISPRLTPEAEESLSGYPPVLRQMLFNRGYETHEAARQYLQAALPAGTDPFGMLGIPEAVERILWAVAHQELVAIYGDYDADGVTATALLTEVLQGLGGEVRGYIPNRFDEGYGLNNEALDNLHGEGVKLVITVDCGIRSIEEALHASRLGLDLIVSDHHLPGRELPRAQAVINPKQPGDAYLQKDLAGVGLAYKLGSALLARAGQNADLSADDSLDLVALGTVADIAPLVGENRALVRAGLERLRRPHRQGILALMGTAGLKAHNLSAGDIGFGLGPRLNAAGRLESALDSLNLLLTQNIMEAGRLAQKLEVQNRERQLITHQTQEHAEQLALSRDPQALLLFAVDPGYNRGVVGLAASRLTERYYRPAIVAQTEGEYTRGSCRSIPEFHITEALDQCADLLEHHGGHAAAAGFTVRNENLERLMERMQAIAWDSLSHLDLRPVLQADLELPLVELKADLLKFLTWLQPTGHRNPEAVFVSRNLKVSGSRAVGRDGAHLKLTVTDGYITFDAIAFRMGQWQERMPDRVDLMYTFEVNEYNGRSSLQLNVRDLKPAGMPD